MENPEAQSSPFDLHEYHIPEQEEAEAMLDRAGREAESAKAPNQTGDNYVLLTELFSSVLFFSGLGAKFVSAALRITMLSFGGILLLAGTIVLMHFPVY